MKYIFKISIFFLIFYHTLHAKTLSEYQIETLKMVKEIALQYPNDAGETFENTLMAICLTETNAGLARLGDHKAHYKDYTKSSLGIMQVQVPTARFVAKKYNLHELSKLSDKKLSIILMENDSLNIKLATLYITWLNDRYYDYFTTISRYNGGMHNYKYFDKVIKNLKFIKKHHEFI